MPTPAELESVLDRARIDEAVVEEVLGVFHNQADTSVMAWLLRLRNEVYCTVFVCGKSATSCYVPELETARKRIPAACSVPLADLTHLNTWLISCREAQPGVTPKKAKRR